MTVKDKLIAYFYNKANDIEQDYNDQLYALRFKNNDEVDYLELIIKKSRKDLFNEILSDIMLLLGLIGKK